MATITTAQTGNWSDTATWVLGVVPVSGDTVILNQNVSMDIDVDGITFLDTGSGKLLITDSKSLTDAIFDCGRQMVEISSTVAADTINLSGSYITRGDTNIELIDVLSPCNIVININASCLDMSASREHYIFDIRNVVNLSGNAIFNASTVGTLAIFRNAGGTVDLDGVFNGAAVDDTSRSLVLRTLADISGQLRGVWTSDGAPCVYRITSDFEISGVWSNGLDYSAIICKNWKVIDGEELKINAYNQTGDVTPLYTANSAAAGQAAEGDVRDGVLYGPSDEFEGTLSPVNVDTAQLASDLLDDIQTSSHVVAQRLRAAATDDSVGSIVASTLGAP